MYKKDYYMRDSKIKKEKHRQGINLKYNKFRKNIK